MRRSGRVQAANRCRPTRNTLVLREYDAMVRCRSAAAGVRAETTGVRGSVTRQLSNAKTGAENATAAPLGCDRVGLRLRLRLRAAAGMAAHATAGYSFLRGPRACAFRGKRRTPSRDGAGAAPHL
jgi:hypothetical protein